ncbi:MAG: prephenate dehydratase [Corynebacteriales bacterium]|nr:prephenate dehydratase [Mycobacteriales bacterium]
MAARMSFLGPSGTFTEQALRTFPDAQEWETIPAASISDALDMVGETTEAAVVPMENSVEGAVGATMDYLLKHPSLMIVGEALLEVAFGLYGKPGLAQADIATVSTHPHAYAQCRGWLSTHVPQARYVAAASTADAARAVRDGEFDAAVCAAIAGANYGLTALAPSIADNPGAVTRFVRVAKAGRPPEPTGDDVTSLALTLPHDQSGSLQIALTQFSVRGVNLSRIESRPVKQQLGVYWFFLDCSGHIADAPVAEAFAGLRRVASEVRFFGSYPRAARSPLNGPENTAQVNLEHQAAIDWVAELRSGNF